MAFVVNQPIISSEMISLKAKVKAEVLRRSQSGSVSSYGGSSYDYNSTDIPTSNRPLQASAYNKIIEPAKSIGDLGTHNTLSSNQVIKALGDVNSKVTTWAARNLEDRTSTDCRSGCTGTCYTGCNTGCYTGCTSCTSCTSCTGCTNCTGCGSGCPSGCGGCGDACTGCGSGCPSSCSGCTGCGSGCDTTCTGCGSGCPSGCSSCGGACSTGCSGCGSGCAGSGSTCTACTNACDAAGSTAWGGNG